MVFDDKFEREGRAARLGTRANAVTYFTRCLQATRPFGPATH